MTHLERSADAAHRRRACGLQVLFVEVASNAVREAEDSRHPVHFAPLARSEATTSRPRAVGRAPQTAIRSGVKHGSRGGARILIDRFAHARSTRWKSHAAHEKRC